MMSKLNKFFEFTFKLKINININQVQNQAIPKIFKLLSFENTNNFTNVHNKSSCYCETQVAYMLCIAS